MGAGDNLASVWNFWWAGTATLAERASLWTPELFAPFGTSLLLHTLTPLPTLLAALLFPSARPLTAYNVSIIVAIVLNSVVLVRGSVFTDAGSTRLFFRRRHIRRRALPDHPPRRSSECPVRVGSAVGGPGGGLVSEKPDAKECRLSRNRARLPRVSRLLRTGVRAASGLDVPGALLVDSSGAGPARESPAASHHRRDWWCHHRSPLPGLLDLCHRWHGNHHRGSSSERAPDVQSARRARVPPVRRLDGVEVAEGRRCPPRPIATFRSCAGSPSRFSLSRFSVRRFFLQPCVSGRPATMCIRSTNGKAPLLESMWRPWCWAIRSTRCSAT